MDKADPYCEDDGTGDPYPDLHAGALGAVQRRMQSIVDAEEKERDPPQ